MSNNTQIALDKEELRSLVADVLEVDVEEVTDDADLVQDLEVDSLMALAIIVRLDRQYGVKLQESDFRQVSSLIDVLQLITDKRTAQAAS
ncbi:MULTISPECIES: acyl carrier protein [Streptomyces]|uniref:acyl carrier protein n=1 Tax=Streptomyces TaxID=1883 RepID=UPI002931A350|nr:acyl carrier protein [Streptomyces sp. NEAU-HV9]